MKTNRIKIILEDNRDLIYESNNENRLDNNLEYKNTNEDKINLDKINVGKIYENKINEDYNNEIQNYKK